MYQKKLKIAYIHAYFGTKGGSWSSRPYELATRWVLQGEDVTVITAPYYKTDITPKGIISNDFIDGVHVKIINSPDSNLYGFLRRFLNAVIFSSIASWLVVWRRYDVVISSSGPITIGIPGLFAKWIRKSRFVFEVRDLWPEGAVQMGLLKGHIKIKFAYWFENLCYRNADLIIPLSKGMESDIKNRFESVNTCVVTNMANTELFSQGSQNAYRLPNHLTDKKLFVYFGSLGLMDACEEIIEAINLLRQRKDICIVFIGTGALELELKELVKGYGLSNQIHFIGLLPKTELSFWLNAAVASFVMFKPFPVLSTVSPNKMFDSFAAGLPIIHNTNGWIKELVDTSVCGISVPSKDSGLLADAILKMADDVSFRNSASAAAFELGSCEFNVQGRSSIYLNAIQDLIT